MAMSLPEVIEMVPLAGPVRAAVAVPGSKSITNRALVLAALAEGETVLKGALWSEDTQVMVDCLQELGFMVTVAEDPAERCNRTVTVYGLGGTVPRGGSREQPLELFVGNAGTAARFLAALICLGDGVYRLHGVPRMHERPQAGLFAALRELGYRIESNDDHLPALFHGSGPKPGARCRVLLEQSSQFASALLLSGTRGGWTIENAGASQEELPYVEMTSSLIEAFPHHGGAFQIEPDASSGSYFWGAGWLQADPEPVAAADPREPAPDSTSNPRSGKENRTLLQSGVTVQNWPASGWQLDADFPFYVQDHREFRSSAISRAQDLADSIMTAIVLAPLARRPIRFTELGRLRVQECERVAALRTELSKCGAQVVETGDVLEVFPSPLHGAVIETYHDHRMAMCFAILGLKVAGIKIKNPACVKKTFPNFFQKLASPPPRGLGAQILDGTGGVLANEQLFAE